MPFLTFFLYTILNGLQQGIITWLFREMVPPKYQEWIDAALHKGGILIYALVYGVVLAYELRLQGTHPQYLLAVVELAALAFLARVVGFDVSLNAARSWFDHREGRAWTSPWAVGTSASSDKFINWQARLLSLVFKNTAINSSRVRLFWWVVTLLALIAWAIL